MTDEIKASVGKMQRTQRTERSASGCVLIRFGKPTGAQKETQFSAGVAQKS
jgi:hypothetical protein